MVLKLLSYPRALLIPFLAVVHTFICSIVTITILLIRIPRSWVDLWVMKVWAGGLIEMTGTQVDLRLPENFPKSGFLFLFSHSSHYDVPLLMYKANRSFRFGAKEELFKIPIFSQTMALAGTLKISRKNRSKVMETYKEAERRVANGESFALAPEGTRRDAAQISGLSPFKSGPFIFAINAKMPLVPVIFKGAEKILPKGSVLVNWGRWRPVVKMQILDPIPVEGLTEEDYKELKQRTYDIMSAAFEKL